MLSYTEIKPGSLVVLEGDPFEVVATSGVVKKQRQTLGFTFQNLILIKFSHKNSSDNNNY